VALQIFVLFLWALVVICITSLLAYIGCTLIARIHKAFNNSEKAAWWKAHTNTVEGNTIPRVGAMAPSFGKLLKYLYLC
jgi:hypothetical protein